MPVYIATLTTLENVLLSGLVGAIVGGIFTLVGSIYIVQRSLDDTKTERENNRLRDVQSGILVPRVEPNGTMYVKNASKEALILKVRQQRLLLDLQNTTPDTTMRNQIYEGIAKGEDKKFHPDSYSTKLDKVTMGSGEILQVQDCEMYGLVAEKVREVLVATILDFRTIDKQLSFRRIYIHRFTMGDNVPEPRADWTPIYSVSIKT